MLYMKKHKKQTKSMSKCINEMIQLIETNSQNINRNVKQQ